MKCEAVTERGQCNFNAQPGSKFCQGHGGNQVAVAARKAVNKTYKLMQWADRVARHSEHENVKSLRDEVGILRMVLEERLTQCKDAVDLVLNAGVITNLVDKIEKTVTSCHKLEGSMGQLLDKQALIQFADIIIASVGSIFPDATPEQMMKLGDAITAAMSSSTNNPSNDLGTVVESSKPLADNVLADLEDAGS